MLLLPPAGLLFAIRHFGAARAPLAVGLLGLLLASGPPVVNRLLPVDLGPRDALVDGERHVTLTGWDRDDYQIVRELTDVVVLQMANPDVMDTTLRLLAGLDQLRELDLNNTPITDAGFWQHLAGNPRLRELDLRGTAVSRETVDAWPRAEPGRRALR